MYAIRLYLFHLSVQVLIIGLRMIRKLLPVLLETSALRLDSILVQTLLGSFFFLLSVVKQLFSIILAHLFIFRLGLLLLLILLILVILVLLLLFFVLLFVLFILLVLFVFIVFLLILLLPLAKGKIVSCLIVRRIIS